MADTSARHLQVPQRRGPSWIELLQEVAGRLAAGARNASYRTWPYRLSLSGPMPDRILCQPVDFDPVSHDFASAVMSGRFEFAGGVVKAKPTTPPWQLVPPSREWAEALHGFEWIRHFEGLTGEAAKNHLHWLLTTWLESCGRWHAEGWEPDVIARRLSAWCSHGRLLFEGGDMIWRSNLLRSMAFQARHLARTAKHAEEGEPRLTAAIGLCISGVCLPDGGKRLEIGMALLRQELERQIVTDGGHLSRSPQAQMRVLAGLARLRDALEQRKRSIPGWLNDVIAIMSPVLAFFRHGDGRLALFNGASEGTASSIDAILRRNEVPAQTISSVPATGYERLESGRTLILLDAGKPPAGASGVTAHAGCLAFEMSVGRNRLIVNCGSPSRKGQAWVHASRTTAAHSTVTLADRSSASFVSKPIAERLLGPRVIDGPSDVTRQRNESADGIWLTAQHDGYAKRFDLIHERRLFLRSGGDDLRGEDRLIPTQKRRWKSSSRQLDVSVPFAARFHLHPDVKSSISRDGDRVLLILPNGDGWQFRASRASLALEDSIYVGNADGSVRRSRQVVIQGIAHRREGAVIKWALQRLTGKKPPDSNQPSDVA